MYLVTDLSQLGQPNQFIKLIGLAVVRCHVVENTISQFATCFYSSPDSKTEAEQRHHSPPQSIWKNFIGLVLADGLCSQFECLDLPPVRRHK